MVFDTLFDDFFSLIFIMFKFNFQAPLYDTVAFINLLPSFSSELKHLKCGKAAPVFLNWIINNHTTSVIN